MLRKIAVSLVVLVLAACGSTSEDSPFTPVETSTTTTTAPKTPQAIAMKARITEPAMGIVDKEWALIFSVDGSWRATAPDGNFDNAYDANTRTETKREVNQTAPSFSEVNNLPPGPPDYPRAENPVVHKRLAAYVASRQLANDPLVKEATVLDRKAYRMEFDLQRSEVADTATHADVTIDAETSLPLLVKTLHRGEPRDSFEAITFTVDPEIATSQYKVEPKPSDGVNNTNARFTEMSADEAEKKLGYRPPIPTTIPAGMSLIRVLALPGTGEATGGEGMNGPSIDTSALEYRSGWRSFVITYRKTGTDPSKWDDPLESEGIQVDRLNVTKTTLENGALKGATANILISPEYDPHLWAVGQTLVLTVTGIATDNELKDVANSLQ